jgi:NAD(P)-dependent dehydrogenase (short-subunit alcohol dehydrogenase family)
MSCIYQATRLINTLSVNNLAHTAPYQLRNTNIRINSICPGLIETGMTEVTFDYANSRGSASKLGQYCALGRYGVAEGMLLTSC